MNQQHNDVEAARRNPELLAERDVRTRTQDQRTPTNRPRKTPCRARLTVPGRTPDEGDSIYTCTRIHPHKAEETHVETGRVRYKDGRVFVYTIDWKESDPEVWRATK